MSNLQWQNDGSRRSGSFRRNLWIMGILHAAALGILLMLHKPQKMVKEEIVWLSGDLGGESAAAPPEDSTPEPPEPEPATPTPPEPPIPVEPPVPMNDDDLSEKLAPMPTPTPEPTPKPVAKSTATPTPKPTARPTPRPSPRPRATPRPTARPTPRSTPRATARPTPRTLTKPKPESTPRAAKSSVRPTARPVARNESKSTEKSSPGTEPKPGFDSAKTTKKGTAEPGSKATGQQGTGSGPGTGAGSGTGGGAGLLNSYFGEVQQLFTSVWDQPVSLPRTGAPPVTTLRLWVKRDGTILRSEIERSSGNSVMDDSVLTAARRVSSVPPVPKGIGSDDELSFAINFELDQAN